MYSLFATCWNHIYTTKEISNFICYWCCDCVFLPHSIEFKWVSFRRTAHWRSFATTDFPNTHTHNFAEIATTMTTATTSRRNSNFFILSFSWKEKMPKEILMRITAPVLHYFVELLFQLLLHYSQEEKTVCHHKCRYRCHCYYWYHCGDISKAVFVAFPRMYIVKNYSLMFLVVGQKWSQAISKHQKFHHEWQEKVLRTVVMMVAKIFISFLSQRIITFVCLFLPLHCFFSLSFIIPLSFIALVCVYRIQLHVSYDCLVGTRACCFANVISNA